MEILQKKVIYLKLKPNSMFFRMFHMKQLE